MLGSSCPVQSVVWLWCLSRQVEVDKPRLFCGMKVFRVRLLHFVAVMKQMLISLNTNPGFLKNIFLATKERDDKNTIITLMTAVIITHWCILCWNKWMFIEEIVRSLSLAQLFLVKGPYWTWGPVCKTRFCYYLSSIWSYQMKHYYLFTAWFIVSDSLRAVKAQHAPSPDVM